MDMQLFADRLRECRELANVSVAELSEATGVERTTLYRYEHNGFKSVKQPVLEKIADYLGVSIDYLTGNSNSKYNTAQLTKKDKKEITEILELTTKLLQQDGLMFDGNPADEDSVRSILDAMEVGLEIAKRKNKEKYGGKK